MINTQDAAKAEEIYKIKLIYNSAIYTIDKCYSTNKILLDNLSKSFSIIKINDVILSENSISYNNDKKTYSIHELENLSLSILKNINVYRLCERINVKINNGNITDKIDRYNYTIEANTICDEILLQDIINLETTNNNIIDNSIYELIKEKIVYNIDDINNLTNKLINPKILSSVGHQIRLNNQIELLKNNNYNLYKIDNERLSNLLSLYNPFCVNGFIIIDNKTIDILNNIKENLIELYNEDYYLVNDIKILIKDILKNNYNELVSH